MPFITIELLRKRSEHNEGMISTLEEISLHQEEIEKIELIGKLCRKLKILYLQNNIIEKIEDLQHLKELEYLNLALNNITKIEGLHNCEFLNKLDLTLNFIDFDTLKESIEHLKPLEHLKELYLIGNPCQSKWNNDNNNNKYRKYIIASLPQLKSLDGIEITKTDQIIALQEYNDLKKELDILSNQILNEKNHTKIYDDIIEISQNQITDISPNSNEIDNINKTEVKKPYTATSRKEMYLEIAEQKEQNEKRKKENFPKERNYEQEHLDTIKKTKEKESSHVILQRNEGKWEFTIDEGRKPGYLVIEIFVPKFLDSSLINIDAHPTYITVVIKNKIIRLRYPQECNSDAGKAERSKTTGSLMITLPFSDSKYVERIQRLNKLNDKNDNNQNNNKNNGKKPFIKTKKISEQLITDSIKKSVNIYDIISNNNNEKSNYQLKEINTIIKNNKTNQQPEDDHINEDMPPELF